MDSGTGGLDIPASLEKKILGVRLVVFDFDGVFTDNMVYVFQDGTEAVRCSRGDGLGLAHLREAGIETVIVSTEPNPVVSARADKLRMRCIQGCGDKLSTLVDLAGELDLEMESIAFVGNDVNDLDCLRAVGLPIVVADAHDDLANLAAYRTRTAGGQGAVREVCDLLTKAHAGTGE